VAAINCVFHKVAHKTSAVCKFDEKLLSLLLGSNVLLSHCMAEGDGSCVFSRFVTESRARDRR
jgi:predicted ArsR family transcriptional regulator